MILLKYLFKEIFNNKKFAAFFIINICLGLLCFSTVDSVKNAIESALKQRSKKILTSDISVHARRHLSDDERQKALAQTPEGSLHSENIEMFTMASNKDLSRLVYLKAIEINYPLYGEILLSKNQEFKNQFKTDFFSGPPSALIYPEIATQLNLKIGDKIKIGNSEVVVADIITEDSSNVYGNNSFTPAIYFPKDQLATLDIVKKGSTLFNVLFIKLPPVADLTAVSSQIDQQYSDPAVHVTTHVKSSEQVARLTQYLNDYLGLASLVALFLSVIGGYFLFRNFVFNKKSEIALFMSFGWSYNKAFFFYLLLTSTLALISGVLCISLNSTTFYNLNDYINPLLPIPLELQLKLSTIASVFAASLLGSLFACLPLWPFFKNVQPRDLIQDTPIAASNSKLQIFLLSLPGIVLFWLMSVVLSHSFVTGTIFTLAFAGSLILLWGLGLGVIKLTKRFKNISMTTLIAIRNIQKQPHSFILLFVVLGMCHLLSSLPAQLKNTLHAELESPEKSRIPSLFFFDIQEDQLAPLKSRVQELGTQLTSVSPLVRARITKINDQEFVRTKLNEDSFTREEQKEKRFRNRGFNLTYRNQLSADEEIVEGQKKFTPIDEDIFPVSLEIRFAERLGIKLNDIVEFDILGVPLRAQVQNFRKIKWTSFQPNFFIQFDEGVLEEAPKTYLASLPPLNYERKQQIQIQLSKEFSNVSMIDVTRLVKKILDIINQMSQAITLISLFSTIIGLIIIYIVINHHFFIKRKEINLLKIVGGETSTIHKIFFKETLIMSLLAILFSSFICLFTSFIISQLVFQSRWVFEFKELILNSILALLLTMFITWLNLRKYTNSKPALYLE